MKIVALGDSVAHRVEERADVGPGPTALTGNRPVEDVGETGEDEADHAEQEMALIRESRNVVPTAKARPMIAEACQP